MFGIDTALAGLSNGTTLLLVLTIAVPAFLAGVLVVLWHFAH